MSNEKRLWIIEARDGAWGANGICKGELVRCKDCKYGITQGITDGFVLCSKPYTERGNAMHRTDWFCADGERKEKDDD